LGCLPSAGLLSAPSLLVSSVRLGCCLFGFRCCWVWVAVCLPCSLTIRCLPVPTVCPLLSVCWVWAGFRLPGLFVASVWHLLRCSIWVGFAAGLSRFAGLICWVQGSPCLLFKALHLPASTACSHCLLRLPVHSPLACLSACLRLGCPPSASTCLRLSGWVANCSVAHLSLVAVQLLSAWVGLLLPVAVVVALLRFATVWLFAVVHRLLTPFTIPIRFTSASSLGWVASVWVFSSASKVPPFKAVQFCHLGWAPSASSSAVCLRLPATWPVCWVLPSLSGLPVSSLSFRCLPGLPAGLGWAHWATGPTLFGLLSVCLQ